MGVLGGAGWKFLVTTIYFSQKHLPGVLKRKKKSMFFSLQFFFFKNVPGVLKRMQFIYFFGGSGSKFLVTEFFSQKHLPGVLKRKKKGFT